MMWPYIAQLFDALRFLFLALSLFAFFKAAMRDAHTRRRAKKRKHAIVLGFFLLLLRALIPTSKTIVLMKLGH